MCVISSQKKMQLPKYDTQINRKLMCPTTTELPELQVRVFLQRKQQA